jgi:aryl-alcohol dehydrogenase-like predicted oxidoreductase
MHHLVQTGKVRYIGVSNWQAWRLALSLGRSDAQQLTRFASVQPRYNLLFREYERELFPLCAAEGLGVIPYNPLAGGLLSGKHRRQEPPAAGTRFTVGTSGQRYQERYWNDRAFDTVEMLQKVADGAGLALPTMALAWVLANPVITAPIIGASSPEQLDATLAALQTPLDADLKEQLDDLTVAFRFGDAER